MANDNQDQLIKLVRDVTQASALLTASVESLRSIIAHDLTDGQKSLLDSVEDVNASIAANTECLENCKNKERCSTLLNKEHADLINDLKSVLSDEERYGLKSLLKGIRKLIDVVKYFLAFGGSITLLVALYKLGQAYFAMKGAKP